jgi:AsmA protein
LAVALIVAVGGVLYYAAQRALDPKLLTAALQRAVHRATGRDLSIGGPVRLSIGLAPSVTIDDVSLSNIEGGSQAQMLTAKSLRAQVALLPLLSGDAVVETMTIEQPDILLERAPDGTPNWQFTPARRALFQGSGGESSGGGAHVEIHTLHIEGGQVTWRPRSGTPLALTIDSLTASNDNADAPLTIDLRAENAGQPLTLHALTGSLDRLQGGPVSAMAGAWPLSVQVKAGAASAKLDGGIAHPDQMRGYIFSLTGNIPDVSAIEPYFPGASLPPLRDVNLSARLTDDTAGELRPSQLSLRAGAADLSAWVTGLSIKQAVLDAPGPGQNVQLNIEGTYANAPLLVAATVMQPDVASQSAPMAATITGQAGNAVFSAKGTLPPGLGSSGLDLVVSAQAPDLSELSALVGHALPAAHDVKLDVHAEDAGFKLRGITLQDLSLNSSIAQVEGNVTVIWSPRPVLNGTLAAGRLDLDTLLPNFSFDDIIYAPPATPRAGPGSAPAAGAATLPSASALERSQHVISNHRLNFAPLRNADADLTLSAGLVTAGGESVRDFSAHLTLAGGKAALNPFRFAAKSGALVGGASLDASADQPPVAIDLRANAFPSSVLAAWAGAPEGASGAVQLDVQLSGAGQTPQALAATLEGHAGLSMVDGDVDGALIESLLGDVLLAAGAPALEVGTTSVRCLALRADVSHGVATMRALSVDTSRLSLDGSGDIDLGSETLDLHLRPSLHASVIAVNAPVALTGTMAAPRAALDPVFGGGRVGFSIGGASAAPPSDCAAKLSIARGGALGPMPAQGSPQSAQPFTVKKPKDLLQGLFH